MNDQNAEPTADEYVLRRIPECWVDQALEMPVKRSAFEPNKKRDTNGLSVFRELFVTAQELAAAGNNRYYVARFKVAELNELGLDVIADPQKDQLPGHALIPQLNAASIKGNQKSWSTGIQLELAKMAWDRIVLTPQK